VGGFVLLQANETSTPTHAREPAGQTRPAKGSLEAGRQGQTSKPVSKSPLLEQKLATQKPNSNAFIGQQEMQSVNALKPMRRKRFGHLQ
jgi:hypothetical protein